MVSPEINPIDRSEGTTQRVSQSPMADPSPRSMIRSNK
jgi:hypothetical protein